MHIDDEDQARHSIYRTEVGQFAIGAALSDEQLYELCRDHADEIGSIKLLVSPSHAPVHESEPPVTSPVANTIIPPVLPQHDLYQPLKPNRKPNPSSRRGSLSSATSERHPAEVNAGYEASVSDDLDHDRDIRRPPIRPLPPGPSLRARSPVARRPQSPSSNRVFSPDRAQVHSPEMLSARSDRTPRNALPTPPALTSSPHAQRFEPSHYSPWNTPTEPVPERSQHAAHKSEPKTCFDRDAAKDKEGRAHRKDTHAIRRENGVRRPKGQYDNGWTMVPSNGPASDYVKDRSPASSRQSPSTRGHPSPQQLNIPPNPQIDPPAPPVEGRGGRGAKRNVVPPGWALAYNPGGSGRPDKTPVTSPQTNRMLAKSMNDLRGTFKSTSGQIPPSLQPGRNRPPPPQLPLPTSRPNTSGSIVSNGPPGLSAG